jgi:Lon protease-like protein
MVAVMPMFPLGTVLVPTMVLPLHVFEPRYRRLVHDCLAGDGEFGVVLIERGSEVGGGDVRTDVGAVARILQAAETPDGRFALAAVGVRRLLVERWLEDDPYPRAEVRDWPDPPTGADELGVHLGEAGDAGGAGPASGAAAVGEAAAGRAAQVTALLRRAAALSAELGEPAPPLDLELSDDLTVASYQATAVAPLGPADKQDLLRAPSVPARFVALVRLLRERTELLEARLAGG